MTIDMRLESAAGNAPSNKVCPIAVKPTEAETLAVAIAKGCICRMVAAILCPLLCCRYREPQSFRLLACQTARVDLPIRKSSSPCGGARSSVVAVSKPAASLANVPRVNPSSTMLPLYSGSLRCLRPGFDHQRQYRELVLSIRSDMGPQSCITNEELWKKSFVLRWPPATASIVCE